MNLDRQAYIVATWIIGLVLCASLCLAEQEGQAPAANNEDVAPTSGLPGPLVQRFQDVWVSSNCAQWPRPPGRTLAPDIDKSVLGSSAPVTKESVGVDVLRYGSDELVLREWEWRNLVPNPNPPTELPEEYLEMLRVGTPEYVRSDPEKWNRFLARRLNAYKKSKARILQGTIRIALARADSPEAVYRWWICDVLLSSSLPVDAIKSQFSEREKLALGTVAYGEVRAGSALIPSSATIRCARNNIGVIITANGVFATEALAVAEKIDALIQQQPILTSAQLEAKRPQVQLADTVVVEKTGSATHRFLPFSVSVPAGQRIISTEAWVDGDFRGPQDGRVPLTPTKSGVAKVKVQVITDGLMAHTVEKEIVIGQ